MEAGTLGKLKAFASAELADWPGRRMGARSLRPCPSVLAALQPGLPAAPPLPNSLPPAPLPGHSPPARPQSLMRMRSPAPLPGFPRFTSLPFPPQRQLHRYDWPEGLLGLANKRRPVAPVLLGRTKQKQTEREGPEKLEVATDAEVRGPGRLTRDLGEQHRRRRRRPEGSVAAAWLARSGGLRCLSQLLSQRQLLVGGGGSAQGPGLAAREH